MRPLTPTLEAAQRSPSAEPYLRVLLHDRDAGAPRLRWRRAYAGAEPDGPCAAAVGGGGALLRARIDPATGTLTRQRVAAPASAASGDWARWTPMGAVAASAGVGCAAAGTRALIVAVRADGVTVEAHESADGGATFPRTRTAGRAASAVTAVACATAASGAAAVLWAAGGRVHAATRRRPGGWRGGAAWTRSLASIGGLAAFREADWHVLVSGADAAGAAGVWSTTLGAGGAAPAGSWRPLAEVASAAPGSGVAYRASGAARFGAPRAVFAETRAGGAHARVHLASGVGGTAWRDGLWRDPRPFGRRSPYGLALAAASGGAWLCAPDGVWRAPSAPAAADLGGDVLEAELTQGRRGGRLRLLLRNDGGRYDGEAAPAALVPGGELRIGPGYVTEAGEEASDGLACWIATLRRRYAPGASVVEVEAVDGWGLLEAWRAPRQLVWTAGQASAASVLTAVLRRAGLRLSGSGASGESAALRPAFAVRAGERGAAAARRLLAALPDEIVMRDHRALLTAPDAGDAPAASFGGGAHPLTALAVEDGEPATGWARVFGRGAIAEAIDEDALAAGGGAEIVVDDNAADRARADARAAAVLRRSRLALARGELTARPHAGLEVGDAVAVTSERAGLAAEPFRVAGLRLRYARGGPRAVYEQCVALGEA